MAGRATGHSLAPLLDPDPSPQGGGQEFAAPLQRKLAQMRVAPTAGNLGMPLVRPLQRYEDRRWCRLRPFSALWEQSPRQCFGGSHYHIFRPFTESGPTFQLSCQPHPGSCQFNQSCLQAQAGCPLSHLNATDRAVAAVLGRAHDTVLDVLKVIGSNNEPEPMTTSCRPERGFYKAGIGHSLESMVK